MACAGFAVSKVEGFRMRVIGGVEIKAGMDSVKGVKNGLSALSLYVLCNQ